MKPVFSSLSVNINESRALSAEVLRNFAKFRAPRAHTAPLRPHGKVFWASGRRDPLTQLFGECETTLQLSFHNYKSVYCALHTISAYSWA